MHLSLSAKLGRLPLFSGILDQVKGAAFAIAPYTQLSRTQTQSIEVRETGGDTEQVFGPESQAAIEAFVGSENLVLRSEEFDNAAWDSLSGGLVVTANQAESPVGTMTADEVTLSNDFRAQHIQNKVEGVQYTMSVYMKTETGTRAVQIRDVAGTGQKLVTVTTEWQRFSLTITAGSGVVYAAIDQRSGGADTTGKIFIWGWQVNTGATAATYNRTTTGIGGDGRIATAYNQGSEAADALQATAANQPFIATAGVLEDGMRFDGTQWQSIGIASSILKPEEVTYAFWAKAAATGGARTFFSNRENIDNGVTIWQEANNNLVSFDYRGILGDRWETNYQLPLDTWVHVAFTRTASGRKLYINGSLQDTIADAGETTAGDTFGTLGGREGAGSYDGLLDAFAIWNRELTSDEITKVYNATDPR